MRFHSTLQSLKTICISQKMPTSLLPEKYLALLHPLNIHYQTPPSSETDKTAFLFIPVIDFSLVF
jgi:hypothetical protein